MKKKENEKLQTKSSWTGSVLVGVGTVLFGAAAAPLAVGMASVGASVLTANVAVGAATGGLGKLINRKVRCENEREAQELRNEASKSQMLMDKMKEIREFKRMSQDSAGLDKLFKCFNDDIKYLKQQVDKMNDAHQQKKYNLIAWKFIVERLIELFEKFQRYSTDIFELMNDAINEVNVAEKSAHIPDLKKVLSASLDRLEESEELDEKQIENIVDATHRHIFQICQ